MYTDSSSGLDSGLGVSHEVVDGETQDVLHLLQFDFAAADLRRVKRGLVVVAKQMIEVERSAAAGRAEQMLGENHARSLTLAIGAALALADAIEAVARRNHPRIGRRPLQILAEILEDGGMLGRHGGEVIQGFVDSGGEAGGGDVVAQNSLVGHVGEEARLRRQLAEHVGNVFLPLGREGLLVPRAAAERDHDDLALFASGFAADERAGAHQRGPESNAGGAAQKFAAAAAERAAVSNQDRSCA